MFLNVYIAYELKKQNTRDVNLGPITTIMRCWGGTLCDSMKQILPHKVFVHINLYNRNR